jgi:hypothetical protein
MVWRDLVARLVPGRGASDADAFLDALIAVQVAWRREHAPDLSVYTPLPLSPARHIRQSIGHGRPPSADALAWWDDLRGDLLRRFPDADALALRWLADVAGCQERVVHAARELGARHLPDVSPLDLLATWVERHPTQATADTLAAALRSYLPLPDGGSREDDYYRDYNVAQTVEALVEILIRLDAADPVAPLARGQALIADLVRAHQATRRGALWSAEMSAGRRLGALGGTATTPESKVLQPFLSRLLWANRLSRDELEALLLEYPALGYVTSPHAHAPAARAELAATVDRLLARALAADPDPHVEQALAACGNFVGMDHLKAACHWYDAHPGYHWRMGEPVLWPDAILLNIRPPSEADAARAAELAAFQPATLLIVAVQAPTWASVVEGPLDWPGLASLLAWLGRTSGAAGPWSAYQRGGGDEDGLGTVDRAAALEAVELMGEQRLRQLLRHPLVKGPCRHGVYYLQAVLGWNAADVEASFLKRDKRAVRALGMLPDEGDVLDRYLALRRFAHEARQFKPQRQASEQLAAESGLANLAQSAGYDDLSQLEWTMEAQLVQEVAPAGHRWTVGDYVVWIDAGDGAAVRAERGGRQLKDVPAAVRRAPAYAEITEARDALRAQLDRVRRRLERAMALGETFDAAAFVPALTTPAGQALLPRLVLRCWPAGAAEPVELLDWRTLAGEPLPPERLERFAVAHPLHLVAAGTLATWQRHLVAQGLTQPFNQLFRERYPLTDAERASHASRRLAGRQVRREPLLARLQAAGWRPDWYAGLARRFPGRLEAMLSVSGAPLYMATGEPSIVEEVRFNRPYADVPPDVAPLYFSEALRDLDLASAAAAPSRAIAAVSRETLAARADLARALVPRATVDGDAAHLMGHTLDLRTGAVHDASGASLALGDLPAPPAFPYPAPDADTAAIAARLLYLASLEPLSSS